MPDLTPPLPNFNSIMVRLRLGRERIIALIKEFQFHNGTIKTVTY